MIVPFYEYGHNQLSASSGHQLHFPLHLHNCPEMILIRAGSMRAQIGDREYTLQAGDLAIILPNITHSYHTLTSPEETLLDLITCGHNPQSALPRQLSGRILTEPVKPIASYHPDVAYAFSALLSEAGNTDSAPIVSAYLQILWHRLLPSLDTADAMTPTTSNLAATLITYVTERFRSPLSLDSLSRELGVSRFHISRIFTQVLHTGFYEYVNALRINYAKELLLDSEYKILDIAEMSGFQSQQTFNRIFRDFCGMPPSAYRKQH
ncbi:MAG: helix-turn-helix transcriptional regulator [Lachnospiraceae bacterium]|uniref:helix-turn-helix transcriptional regulator n=1 Tax=uncultured Acetatifactor sp. TaxID=1671927 RepID=UPI00260F96EA|nr:AraC family transcriptional regulator [uncultured Acetatifactor sp.]MCI8788779.1 helix-turn-helix transcriptional regulator [Lachnospiraceae bacterium]